MSRFTRAFCLVSVLGLNACAFEPLYPDAATPDAAPTSDATPADASGDAAVPTDAAPATDSTPVDTGTPFRCTAGLEIDARDCLGTDMAVAGTTHTLCNSQGNGGECWFRPGCRRDGCATADAGMPHICTPGFEISPVHCSTVPGVAAGTTHTVCNADGTGTVCVLRPGCSPIGCMTAPPADAGVMPPPPADAGVTAPPATTLDETCDGRRLTGMPVACQGALTGSTCWHMCQITPAYMVDSSHPNASQRPGAIRLIQTEDPSKAIDVGTFSAPTMPTSGVTRWEAGAFVSILGAPAGYPMFNGQNQYAAATIGPFSYLWAAGQNFRGMGLERNGFFRVYRVNADLTQTLVNTEIVANEPVNEGMAAAYYNGGNLHPLGTGCPIYLTARTSGLYRCTP